MWSNALYKLPRHVIHAPAPAPLVKRWSWNTLFTDMVIKVGKKQIPRYVNNQNPTEFPPYFLSPSKVSNLLPVSFCWNTLLPVPLP